jgi:hypothetical protein
VFTNIGITEIELRFNSVYIDIFKASNFSFVYANRFFLSLFPGISSRFNLVRPDLRTSGNPLKSLGYFVYSETYLYAFMYLLIFNLFYKRRIMSYWGSSLITISEFSILIYLKTFDSFFVKPIYDFSDREWSARLRLHFKMNSDNSLFLPVSKLLTSFFKITAIK